VLWAVERCACRTELHGDGRRRLASKSTVLLEKLIVAHLVKKYLASYGGRRFITVFKIAHYQSLS
jgi:hypothetical protein